MTHVHHCPKPTPRIKVGIGFPLTLPSMGRLMSPDGKGTFNHGY